MTNNERGPVLLTKEMAGELAHELVGLRDSADEDMHEWYETKITALRAIASGEAVVVPAGAGDALLRCVDDEPELPGDIPEEMLEAVQNRVTAAETLRIVVRLTKRGIRERLAAALKETGRG